MNYLFLLTILLYILIISVLLNQCLELLITPLKPLNKKIMRLNALDLTFSCTDNNKIRSATIFNKLNTNVNRLFLGNLKAMQYLSYFLYWIISRDFFYFYF